MRIIKVSAVLLIAAVVACSTTARAAVDPTDANWQVELLVLFGRVRDRQAKKMIPSLTRSLNLYKGKLTAGIGRRQTSPEPIGASRHSCSDPAAQSKASTPPSRASSSTTARPTPAHRRWHSGFRR
jgi:hypothetical protein